MPDRFDIAALRKRAGDKVFARGETYHRREKVRIASIEAERVLARVEGNEIYSVELTGRGRSLGGSCSCPAFEDWPICKHMVATALAANELPAESDAAGADARIRKHLKARGVEALVDMIMEMASRDLHLFDKLDLAAATAGTDDKALAKRLRKALDDATSVDDFVDYGGAGSWADEVAQVLDAIGDLNTKGRPHLAIELAGRALDAIVDALDSIDDSDGECGPLLERAQKIHLEAVRLARPDPIALAHDLYHREIEDEYDTFTGAVTVYADALGEAGLEAYRALAAQAWTKLRPRAAADQGDYENSVLYDRLAGILDVFAARENDTDARIALRAKDLSSSWRYLQLVEFCRAQGRDVEALRWAEEGLWIFEDQRGDERLLSVTVDLLVRAGRKADAAEHIRAAFRKAPSFDLYQKFKKRCGQGARDEALAILREHAGRAKPNAWSHPADLLVQILVHEKMMDAAWAAVRKHGASKPVQRGLAKSSEATHPQDALRIHCEHVEELATLGGNPNYAEAAGLIARTARLRSGPEQDAYIEQLKSRHGRKRNFMKLLA